MATRIVATPKKIAAKNLRRLLARPLNSVPSTISAFAAVEEKVVNQAAPAATTPPEIIDLSDPRKLFATVSTSKLLRSAINLHAAAVEPLVDVGTWVMRSRLVAGEGLARDAVVGVVKRTVFEHFCGGEDADEAARSVRKLNEAGLRGMLDYALEDAEDNFSCDTNLEGFLRTVSSARSLPPSSVSFVVAKIAAICPITLLERVADLLRWQHMNPSHHLPWKHHSFHIFSDLTPLYHTVSEPEPLSLHEERDLELALNRLQTLCKTCDESNIPLCIDAEYTSVQPAIDYFVNSSAIEHNRNDRPVNYGTLQAYLKDAKGRLLLASETAEKAGIKMGVKLVRGAYMSTESRVARSLGHESPIHNTVQDTHDCYNECASIMLGKIASGSGAVVLATHNVESGAVAAKKAVELGIGNEKLEFAQLYGMADSFSFGLRNGGFKVSKYMPFGPVGKVIPYLLRRAEENRGILSASTLDRKFIRKELWRRLKAGVVTVN